MTSKERVLLALARQEPDRVPIDYFANPGIDQRLKQHFGLAADDHEGLLQTLHVDFRGVQAPYIGPRLHADEPERGVMVDDWGIHRRWIEHDSGGYWDFCDFPLQEATEEQVAEWPLPSPDDFDYNVVREQSWKFGDHAVYTGNAGLPDIINGNGMLRTMEQTLVDLISDDPAGMLLAQRRSEILLEILSRSLEAARGGIDFVWLGEDLGTQIGPTISEPLYRRQLRPFHQQMVDVAKAYNLPVMIHSCGSSSWAFDDFIEMGIDAVDTLQPEAKNMAPAYLKQRFGGRLAFHGCISTAGPVAYGTTDATIADCRRTLEIMMPGGGYCFSPTHQLQDNSPTENVVAMYETARRYGRYR
ncbi:MAG TPA: uroporphyrinogen decarboxylase family protein [Opitutaceae bacterium]|nr:uroporphyrinogen decarboxylase family protein [Opitutaceae bacterium]HND61152.1 uroporphyrinogen decarboxylase family protein [Opitutaceae bacterium]